ncbi:threonylcarbamoyl-AMP synthase [Candidatus Roizmanbacteria bacterium]|nr:threonylcarbamoyl-AMP synthase [Candidatus Roizmanbacteria bacterium]
MKIVPIKDITIGQVCDVLRQGGVVVIPSDTVYVLAVDAKNDEAVKKLIEIKNRPAGKPISVFTSGFEMIGRLTMLNSKEYEMLDRILPGQFTAVLASRHQVSPLLESEDGTIGIRYIRNEFVTRLVTEFGGPITATSANLSGKTYVHSVDSFLNTLSEKRKQLIDLVIDAGKLPPNKPSTVIDLTQPTVSILRAGDIQFTREEKIVSHSEEETQALAVRILSEHTEDLANEPLSIILKGDLGVGKTVFVKGLGDILGIKRIVSPTYVIYYEYDTVNYPYVEKLIHFDLYNIQSPEEFEPLHIQDLLKPRNLLCIEWGEKIGEVFPMLKAKGKVIFISISHVSKHERSIVIQE